MILDKHIIIFPNNIRPAPLVSRTSKPNPPCALATVLIKELDTLQPPPTNKNGKNLV
tara:strand:- start:257 stop:427 length:171 start_codon:yes stop_codon:yes gene_type:complete